MDVNMKKETKKVVANVVGGVAGAGAAGLVGGIGVTFIKGLHMPRVLRPIYYAGAIGLGGAAGMAADHYVTDTTEAVLDVTDDFFGFLSSNDEPDPLEEADKELNAIEEDMVTVQVPREAYEKYQANKAAKAERAGIIESSTH